MFVYLHIYRYVYLSLSLYIYIYIYIHVYIYIVPRRAERPRRRLEFSDGDRNSHSETGILSDKVLLYCIVVSYTMTYYHITMYIIYNIISYHIM